VNTSSSKGRRFPKSSNVSQFDLTTHVTADSACIKGFAQFLNGLWDHIIEAVGGRMSAATVNNGAEDMRMIAGGLAEEIGRILEVLLCHGLMDG